MPHYDIRLRIVCGETTCAVTAGRFCRYFSYSPLSGAAKCDLFGKLKAKGGWIQRHRRCLTLATPAEKPKGSA